MENSWVLMGILRSLFSFIGAQASKLGACWKEKHEWPWMTTNYHKYFMFIKIHRIHISLFFTNLHGVCVQTRQSEYAHYFFSAKICRNHFFFIILQMKTSWLTGWARVFMVWSVSTGQTYRFWCSCGTVSRRQGCHGIKEKDVYETFYLLHLKIW